MIIEVRGTGVHNKGAELMLCAIRQYLRGLDADIQLAVDPFFGTYAERAQYGLLSKVRAINFGRASVVQQLMSPAFRKTYGLVVDSDIDSILDAAGFAYGDQWGLQPTQDAAQRAEESRRRGQPVVLLPQAFGPFSLPGLADSARRLIEACSLVFARDSVSYEHLQSLGGPYEHVRLAPDFTNIVKGVVPAEVELPQTFSCIVPNVRMLDRGTKQEQQAYLGFLATCLRESRERGIEPMMLLHDEATDRQVVDAVEAELEFDVSRIHEHRPEYLKGILGRATVVIGSRFHALVGALSQGVPCIVAGWSHKYEMLLEDYGCPELLVKPSCELAELRERFDQVTSDDSRADIIQRLRDHGCTLRQQVDEMFDLTGEAIGLVSTAHSA